MSQSVYAKNELKSADGSDAWADNDVWLKLLELFNPRAKVLDIGCSSGHFGRELIKQKQCQVVGIDINEADLKVAAKNLTKAVKKDIERDSLADLGVFDFVLMSDVIEHVINPVKVLQKVRKLLKPSGKLVFSVPNMANIANRIELLGGRFEYTEYGLLDETHLHYYDRIELEKVLAQAGFEIEHYNNTIRDIPPVTLKTQLDKLGLTANERFIKMARAIDAITFQFIGTAKPATGPLSRQKAQVRSRTPYDFVSKQFDTFANDIAALRTELANQKSANKRLAKEKQKVLAELNAIKNSKGWRMLEKLHHAKHQLTPRHRQK